MGGSTYYAFEEGVHVLINLNDGANIRNDIERVIRDLHDAGMDVTMPVIYRNLCGDYDRILVTQDGEFSAILPLRTKDLGKAIRTVQSIASLASVCI
jgi:hypothetical protein